MKQRVRRHRTVWMVLTLVLGLGIFSVRPAVHAATTRVVDTDGKATAADCGAASAAFGDIQSAVDAAEPGDTILVCPGSYNEQVSVVGIDHLTIRGSGIGQTILRPTDVEENSTGVLNPFPVAAIIVVTDATGVSVQDLTVDGNLADEGAGNPPCLTAGYFAGVYYRNSSGTLKNTRVTNIGSGSRCTAGLNVASGFDSVADVVVQGNTFDHYGNLGLNCGGPNSKCTVRDNTFTGLGPVSDQIQAGVIFRLGAGGEISGNTITDHFYVPAVGIFEFSVGVALFNAEPDLNPHLKQRNVFAGNQLDVQRQGTAAAFE